MLVYSVVFLDGFPELDTGCGFFHIEKFFSLDYKAGHTGSRLLTEAVHRSAVCASVCQTSFQVLGIP